MNLLTRFIKFLLLTILKGILVLLARIFRILLLPFLIAVLRLTVGLVFFSFSATVNNPGQFIDRLAGEWTARFHEIVHDRSNMHEIYQLCRILVGARIVLGWIVLVAFTVEILRVVFGFFI